MASSHKIQHIYIYIIYIYIIYIYIIIYPIWVRLEIPYPHWEVCLGGMLRRYASGFASGVCFGVCFACTYLVPWRYGQGCLIFRVMQGCEVPYSRVQNVPGSGSWRFEVWNGCDSGMIRVWFAEHYSAHRIRSRQSYNGQSAPEAGRCKRYRLPQWSYSGQSAPKLSPTYLAA